MARVGFIVLFLLAVMGCQPSQPPLPADVISLPEDPGAEIEFLQTRDQVTGIRVRTGIEEEDWFDVPADRMDALFAALHPAGLIAENADTEFTKCDLAHHIQVQGDQQRSLTICVTSFRHTEGFNAEGGYREATRRVPVRYFGHDARRLVLLLQEVEMLAHTTRSAVAK